jgi:serpin B
MKKVITIIICIFILSSFLVACDINSLADERLPANINNQKIDEDNLSTTKDRTYDLENIDPSVVDGNQKFAFDVFKKLNEEDVEDSIFISPLSISQALTMAYNGAETTTKEGMEKALGLSGLDRALVNGSFRNLTNYLGQIDKKINLNIGNSIWIKDDQDINEDFIMNNKENFNAEVETLDFADNKSVDIINNWINKATNKMIDKMLEPPIDKDIIMYLINAIYFKGEWSEQFDPKLTYQDNFTTLDGEIQRVNMMRKNGGSVEFTGNEEYKAVRLPYGNGKTSMYIILPSEGTNINEFINNMTIEKWSGIKKTVSEKEDIVFRIPRFKLDYGTKELKDSLISLGMEEAFGNNADFSGIREEILISSVMHRAVIEVNEEGSEAAGVTIVTIRDLALAEPNTFITDRPFMFIINDDVMDTILFMGKVVSIEE